MRLGSLMTGAIQTVAPGASLAEAAKKMASQDIGSLPVWRRVVVTDGEDAPIGILSLGDIALSLRENEAGEVLRRVSETD